MIAYSLCDYLVVILSIVLESFPISSSGHIALVHHMLEKYGYVCFLSETLEYFLHGPTALVIALFFYTRWTLFFYALIRNFAIIKKLMCYGFITDSITVVAYFLMFKNVSIMPLWCGFLITTVLLFSLYFCKDSTQNATAWNPKNACILGLVQACSLMPGISRFGSTFVAARWLGFTQKKAFELSFLIEFPISCAAALQGTYSLAQEHALFELLHPLMVFVMLIATVGAYWGLALMERLSVHNRMWLLAFYVLAVAIIALLVA